MNRRHFIYAASVGAASATMPLTTAAQGNRDPVSQMPQVGTKLRTITLEEHFVSPGFVSGPGRGFIERLRTTGARGAKIFEQLQDVGDGRMAEMDAAGIDMQVLSLNAPGVEQAEVAEQVAIARESNDFLADVVKNNPRRFAAFASLPIWIAGSASRASRAHSSMATHAAAIWTTSSFGRSWSAPKRSKSRSISIRRCHRSRSLTYYMAVFPRR